MIALAFALAEADVGPVAQFLLPIAAVTTIAVSLPGLRRRS